MHKQANITYQYFLKDFGIILFRPLTKRQLSKGGVGVEHVDFKDATLSPEN